MSGPRRAGRRTTVVACLMFVVGVVLGLDAYWSGSLWRYQFVGYCVAAAMSVPLATRLLFGVRVHWLWRRAFYVAAPLLACLLLGEGAGPRPRRRVRGETPPEPQSRGRVRAQRGSDVGGREPAAESGAVPPIRSS